jgi:5'-nucleotidase
MNPTQEMIKRLFLSVAISVAGLLAGTSSAAAAVTRCDGSLSAGTYDTVLVPTGKTCVVIGPVTVEQNVILQEGASLRSECDTFTVNGNFLGDGVNSVSLIGDSVASASIHGNVSITGATGEVFLDEVIIGGNLQISDSNGFQITVTSSQVAGNALFQANTLTTSPFIISRNRITGNLVCSGNDPAPENQGNPNNVAGQKIGQCSAL